jgi:hypothetical protein
VILTESSEVGEEIDLTKRDLRRLLSTPLRKILTRLSQLSDMSLSLLSIGLGCLVVILVLIHLRATTVNVQDVGEKAIETDLQTLPLLNQQSQVNVPMMCASNETYQQCVDCIPNIGSDNILCTDLKKCLLLMLSYQAQEKNGKMQFLQKNR